MTLENLFVSHKQVDPVVFDRTTPTLPKDDIHLNLERAQKVASDSKTSLEQPIQDNKTDYTTWKVGGDSPYKNWAVQFKMNEVEQKPESVSKGSAAQPLTSFKGVKYSYSKSDQERAKYWMQKFADYGADTNQQLAIVSAMMTECGLTPKGAVEKKELAGKGNTKKGWAHAGEGSVGFTHWSLKKSLIDRFNRDSRRKGAPLPDTELAYSKDNARHISDLDDDDQALITALFYEKLLKSTKGMNFNDTIGEFYMEKAGRGFGQRKEAGNTSYEKAVYTGKIYQKSHAKLGYTKAAKTNTFLKSLDFARNLANTLGYEV